MQRLVEFFEADDNRLSMTRLLMLLSFFPATYFTYKLESEDALLYYLGAYVFGYVGGKGCDAIKGKNNADS